MSGEVGPHDAIIYNGDEAVAEKRSQEEEEDDAFFEVTINDVRKMYADRQTRRQQLEDAPLQTKSARELEKDANTLRLLHDYPITIIRIRFTNRFILQGTFRTVEKLGVVYSWLSSMMMDPHMNFHLFTTPPKKVLDKSLTFAEEDVVGTAVIYFGTDDPSAPKDQKILRPEIYSKLSAPDAVTKFVRSRLKKPEAEVELGGGLQQGVEAHKDLEATSTRRTAQIQPPPKTEGKVPKWFKPK